MFKTLRKLWKNTKRQARRNTHQAETLEPRDLKSVSQLWFNGSTLIVQTDNASTNVSVRQNGTNVVVSEDGTNRSWSYSTSQVRQLQFQGGAGNDRLINWMNTLPIRAFGNAGNDYFEGYGANDFMQGGDGNDTMKGFGGNDTLFGEAGNDVLLGMAGNDQLVGGDGNDRLNGREGNDSLWGQNGDDVLIAVDGGTSDYTEGGAGRDAIWVDKNGATIDRVFAASVEDKVQNLTGFTNGADRSLDGDRIAEPLAAAGTVNKTFANNPLFSQSGPRATDIRQGGIGDCWLLAGLAGIATDSPNTLRQNVVDFDDGTYGVALGGRFYRVDNDLAVANSTSNTPTYAALGAENSMWVAVIEKAFASYRTGANSFASLNGGWSVDVNRAFGSTTAGEREITSFANATALANEIAARWNSYQSVTVGVLSGRWAGATNGVPLVMQHMYSVASIIKNSAGAVTGIVLRNPWGFDGAGSDSNTNDGLVTVTPSQLFGLNGRVNFGRV